MARRSSSAAGMHSSKERDINMKTEMQSEIKSAMAEFRTAEAKRSSDFHKMQTDLNALKDTLLTKSDITTSTRNWALGLGGFLIALVSLLWMFFDTGAGITGSVADKTAETKINQDKQDQQFRAIQETLKQIAEDRARDIQARRFDNRA